MLPGEGFGKKERDIQKKLSHIFSCAMLKSDEILPVVS
ncbi:hypothetical protein H206_00121 [Candidatus Electrothrix aarhusensis]|uniref:Uncharacterized protein n=1 Tax=Candidatus Electrothrix aarhusensis TaxID=1859131 RepID=A0A3S3SP89_9BACT|nr:hypothetical protein H206_00121 [Candidatus Electrothrix aarhusensis]